MPINPVKAKWRAGEAALGGWLSIPSPFVAEVMAHQGFDYLCVDLQHGLIDYQTALGMLQAIRTTDTPAFVRVPQNDFGMINKVLDAGALGVVIPMISSAEDARAAVRACRYPPAGMRSFGPARALFSVGPDYFAHADELVACIPMIETRQAVDELDAILAVPGIDAVYVGPNDLSLALGLPPASDNPGAYQEAYRRIAKACAERGVIAGIHANPELAPRHLASGFRLITVASDLGALSAGAARDLRAAREARRDR
jgi:4-hydroxy-2-oxoheptanedioate aldolase